MKKQTNYIKIIYFIKFFADALFSGYLSMFFASQFDKFSFEYALCLGIIPFCALVGNFVWGFFSKNVKRNLLLMKIVLLFECIAMISFVLLGYNFISLLIFTIFFGIFNSPSFTLQEGLASSYSKKEETSYPSIRYMGSFGYLFALTIGALLINVFNNQYQYIFIIATCLNVICFILWFFVRPFENVKEEEKSKVKFIEVLKNKTFLLYFVAYLLIIGSNNVADSFLFVRLQEVGIKDYQYSLVFASEVLLEIIVLILSTKFIKEKHYILILKIAVFILFLRAFLFGFDFSLLTLYFVAILRGIGWGGFLSVHILILRKVVSGKLVTKAVSLLTIALSFSNGLMTIFGSTIYKQISLFGFYFLLSGIIIIGIIILCLIKFKYQEVNHEN